LVPYYLQEIFSIRINPWASTIFLSEFSCKELASFLTINGSMVIFSEVLLRPVAGMGFIMSKQELRDRSGRLVGYIQVLGSGKHEGRDASGRLKGSYDPRTNETRDAGGRLVGKGDFLSSLITSSLG